MPHVEGHSMSESMRRCIQNCADCHDVCLQTITHCLEKGGRHAEVTHLRLLMDCAQICPTAADFMLRGSSYHGRVCSVCAGLCDSCAVDCEQFGDDEQMQACAAACRRCAASCYEMSQLPL